jgi:hypothetical protein
VGPIEKNWAKNWQKLVYSNQYTAFKFKNDNTNDFLLIIFFAQIG